MNVPRCEKLTRYISDDKHFSKENKRVKYRAFIPQKRSPQELSVYRISSLIDEDSKIWELGKEHVQGQHEIIARADFWADVVYKNNLEVIAATQVHELHANIKPLPLERADRDEILRDLALASELVIMPPEDT